MSVRSISNLPVDGAGNDAFKAAGWRTSDAQDRSESEVQSMAPPLQYGVADDVDVQCGCPVMATTAKAREPQSSFPVRTAVCTGWT